MSVWSALKQKRLLALLRKESLQILRDPAALFIAFGVPPILVLLFAFAVSLDVDNVPVAVVLESDGARAQDLAAAFAATRFLIVHPARHRREVQPRLAAGELKAIVVIPSDFDARLLRRDRAAIQVLTDGSQPNSAGFVAGYVQGVFGNWLAAQPATEKAALQLQARYWFNPELESRQVLLPAAVAVVMTMIGTLLTALVVAREWERGTMEAMLATPASTLEILLSKLLPYFMLGIAATLICTVLSVGFLGMPLRGSLFTLLVLSSVFLVAALGQGLLISTLTRNQFIAVQAALMSALMPALLLSGFIYEIKSMPVVIQWIADLLPARYFVSGLQTVFLAGDLWPQLLKEMAALLGIASLFFVITAIHSGKRLD